MACLQVVAGAAAVGGVMGGGYALGAIWRHVTGPPLNDLGAGDASARRAGRSSFLGHPERFPQEVGGHTAGHTHCGEWANPLRQWALREWARSLGGGRELPACLPPGRASPPHPPLHPALQAPGGRSCNYRPKFRTHFSAHQQLRGFWRHPRHRRQIHLSLATSGRRQPYSLIVCCRFLSVVDQPTDSNRHP